MTETTLTAEPTIPKSAAVFLGKFESNSPEWLKLREGANIGGSDVSTICGLNPWESPFTYWAKKTKRIESNFEPNEAMEWGTLLEPVIMEKFMRQHPELHVIPSPGTYHHPDRTWQIANPDGVAHNADTGESYIIEIKTARYEDDWLGGVPPYYKTQVQWYLHTFNYSKAIVVVLFSGSKYREFEIDADEFEQNVNLARVMQFRELYLMRGEQPTFDGALSTYETVREMHPDIDRELDVELGQLGLDLQAAVIRNSEAEAELNRLKSQVLDTMGKARRGFTDGVHVVSRQAKGSGRPFLIIKK